MGFAYLLLEEPSLSVALSDRCQFENDRSFGGDDHGDIVFPYSGSRRLFGRSRAQHRLAASTRRLSGVPGGVVA